MRSQRLAVTVVGATEKEMVALPVPAVVPKVTHEVDDVTDHEQPAGAVTLIVPLPPALLNCAGVGITVAGHVEAGA
jgi:hypothetical protein